MDNDLLNMLAVDNDLLNMLAVDNDLLNMKPPKEIFLSACVFARILPENKARIIKLLKRNLI